ncbi:calcium-activated potassium channel slowpoke-like [Centruroides sculpturatus]|uniref:calcium-activated potassium channel slowpoke-like n=1 Tax=Centruroides sculpturatus TaxID=218467 RepID=UPI000C6DA3C9|nr:calcium-activated potassium channel slowpoke-like [Centruroides sculpturatus]
MADDVTSIGDNQTTTLSPEEECLQEKKWWCFLLSSIFTFLAGILIILLWRAFAFLCCKKTATPTKRKSSLKSKDLKAAKEAEMDEIGFMTEAKDWAGELISGQSTTGRILVSVLNLFTYLFIFYIFLFLYFNYTMRCRQRGTNLSRILATSQAQIG